MEKLNLDRGADKKNGITRPAPLTKTGHVWTCIDALRAEKLGFMPTKAEVWTRYAATLQGAQKITSNTQYHRYTHYHGLRDYTTQTLAARTAIKKIKAARGELLHDNLKEKRKK